MSRSRAFAQRLRPAIYKYESSLASGGEGKLSGQSVYRDGMFCGLLSFDLALLRESLALQMPLLVTLVG